MDRRLIGFLLLIGEILALVYGGFTYARTTHQAELGALEVQVHDRERVNIPLWFGVAAAVGGAWLMIARPQSH